MSAISKIVRLLTPVDRAALDELLKDPRNTIGVVRAWLAERGCRVGEDGVANYANRKGLRKTARRRVLRIDRILSPAEREAYEAYLADPRTTRALAAEWLKARGHRVSEPAVRRYRNRLLERVDRMRECAMQAQVLMRFTRETGAAGLAEGALSGLEQILMEQLVLYRKDERIQPRDLTELSKSLSGIVGTRQAVESIRREAEDRARRAAEEGAAAAKSGASPREVANRVRDILGMPPMPEGEGEGK